MARNGNETGQTLRAPTINLASVVWGLDAYLRDRSVAPANVFRRCGLSLDDLHNPDRRVPLTAYLDLLEACAKALDDPLFGLRFGLAYDPHHAGVVGNIALASHRVGEALEAMARYLPTMVDGALFGHEEEDGQSLIFVHYYDPLPMSYSQKCDWTVGFCCNIIRRGLGDALWTPDEVQLPSLPEESAEVRRERGRLIGTRVTDGHPWMGLRLDAEILAKPMATADAAIGQLMAHYGDLQLSARPKASDDLDPLRRELARLLVMGRANVESLARSCGLSVRTLQRRLSESGLSYSELQDDVRHRLALNLLSTQAPVMTEIAFSLGYSDVSAFNHAFRRWEKTTPGAWRKTHRADEGAPARGRVAG